MDNKAQKLTKRKGFNFFRSYYDVYNELNNEDKVAFIDALLDRQFLGIKPTELKGMAKFAYISQTNSIDGQVKGYEDKTGLKLDPKQGGDISPTEGGRQGAWQGGFDTPTEQVKEKGKGKVKEKVKDIPNFSEFLDHAISKEPNVDEYALRLKFESWIENGWKDGNNRKISNWKSKLTNTIQFIAKGTNSRTKRKVKVF
tara:strand:- start:364 stop:960 length:597 start_codon:yes stop_codon:yes gene_type:complete